MLQPFDDLSCICIYIIIADLVAMAAERDFLPPTLQMRKAEPPQAFRIPCLTQRHAVYIAIHRAMFPIKAADTDVAVGMNQHMR